jgi:hypothetical protein
MKINITNVNSIRELSGKLGTVFSEKKMQGNQLFISEGNRTFEIKHRGDNLFSVNLAFPAGYYILGIVLGILLCFLTGFTGFIQVFVAILVIHLIIIAIYVWTNRENFKKFMNRLQGACLSNTNESDASSNDRPEDIDMTDESEAGKQKDGCAGCATALLGFIIMANSASAIMDLLANDIIQERIRDIPPLMILLGVVGVANVIFAILLFNWKKVGLWGFTLTSIVMLIIILHAGLKPLQSILGFGFAILYGVLQIKQKSASSERRKKTEATPENLLKEQGK